MKRIYTFINMKVNMQQTSAFPQAILPKLKDVDIRLLSIFLTVAQARGFSAAETELNINASTISRHIKELERKIGFKLCDRGRSGFRLTANGERVLLLAQDLFRSLEAFKSGVNELHENLTGQLRIATIDRLLENPQFRLTEAISAYQAVAPQVTFDVERHSPRMIEHCVLDGQFQLGISLRFPGQSLSKAHNGFDEHYLFDEETRLYATTGHSIWEEAAAKLSWGMLSDQNWACMSYNFDSHNERQVPVDIFPRNRRSIGATANSVEALLILILSGRYIGYLPVDTAEPYVAKGALRLIDIDKARYTLEVIAITRRSPGLNKASEVFLNHLLAAHQ